MASADRMEGFKTAEERGWPDKATLIAERKSVLGSNVALNYSKDPLYIVRGRGQYLIDEKGEEYLDCVNNVCHVGHCQPDVVKAGSEQLAELNTNIRYLSPFIVEYGKKLTATFPTGSPAGSIPEDNRLSVVYWCNSGSEANDLSLRLARAHTKKRGVMCVGGAYHGHVTTIVDISPYKFEKEGGAGQRSWVREAPLPDVYSGQYRGDVNDERMGQAYAEEVEKQLESFAKQERHEAARKALWLKKKAAHEEKKRARKAAAATNGVNSPSTVGSVSPAEGAASEPVAPLAAASHHKAAMPADIHAEAVTTVTLKDGSSITKHGEGPSDGYGRCNPDEADEEDLELAFEFDDDGYTAGCGAFIMESVLSCGGQVMPPKGYLRRVYAAVRAHGGVCIADEVQVGYGRVGAHMWAFQLQGDDILPDILTLGKPMGNGFPVALVVTTPAIARSFANGMELFNTFGGNPVAGRVALEVLRVIKDEKLQENAAKVGKVLLEGFNEKLFPAFDFIGSVRGCGLMVGLEILKSRKDPKREVWPEAASAIVYAMRKRRILLSTDGMASNVIKLKPPMVFNEDNARTVIENLLDVMSHLDEHLKAFKAMSSPASASAGAH